MLRTLGFLSLTATFLFLGSVGNAYQLESASVRYYNYEDGSTKNKLYFEILDDHGDYINDGNIVTGVELYDPNEILVDLEPVTFTPLYELLGGKFELGDNQFIYNPSAHFSDFGAIISDPLILGTYKLVVTTVEGQLPTKEISFNQKIELPIVSYRSFQIHPDPSGNIYWTWDISEELLDMANSTEVVASVWVFDNDKLEFILWVRLPTYMGFLFIPDTVVQQIPSGASKYYYQIWVRNSDRTNRAASEKLIVNDPLTTVPKNDCSKGDLDFDDDVDGEDLAIFSEYFGTILLEP
jgi:hypothetical protein